MMNQTKFRYQSPYNSVNRGLQVVPDQQLALSPYQMRRHLLNQFRQKGVTRSEYIGFQPVSRTF